ncbi:alpha/beta hydrolase, partial [Burkholderia stabilis]
ADARTLAQRLGSAFVNLGEAGHINTAAGFGPWPRAKYFVDTLVHCAAPLRFRDSDDGFEAELVDRALAHAV